MSLLSSLRKWLYGEYITFSNVNGRSGFYKIDGVVDKARGVCRDIKHNFKMVRHGHFSVKTLLRHRFYRRSHMWVVLFFAISAGALSQDYSTRGELENMARYQMRMVGDTFTVNPTQAAWFARDAAKETDAKVRPYKALDTIWTTGGVQVYSLNSDCYQGGVVSVKVAIDTANGIYRAVRSIMSKDIGQTASSSEEGEIGYPKWWVQFGNYISLDPAPQAKFRVEIQYEARSRVFKIEADSTSDSITTIPPELDYLIVDYMRFLIAKRLGLEGLADQIYARWKTDCAEERALRQHNPDAMVSPEKEYGQ